jgi:hypothetical protein
VTNAMPACAALARVVVAVIATTHGISLRVRRSPSATQVCASCHMGAASMSLFIVPRPNIHSRPCRLVRGSILVAPRTQADLPFFSWWVMRCWLGLVHVWTEHRAATNKQLASSSLSAVLFV